MATIYFLYHKTTGRYMGSGTVEVNNAEIESTTEAPDLATVNEEYMEWQRKGNAWIRETRANINATTNPGNGPP